MGTFVVWGSPDDSTVHATNTVYATAREGPGASLHTVTNTTMAIGQTFASPNYQPQEGFMYFDTSALSGTTPTLTTLALWVLVVNTSGDEIRAAVTAPPVIPYDLTAFVAGSLLPTAQATLAVPVAAQYNDFTDVSLSGALNKNGITYLMLWGKKHQAATPPTGGETVDVSSTDTSGTTQDPKLTILAIEAMATQHLAPQQRYR